MYTDVSFVVCGNHTILCVWG